MPAPLSIGDFLELGYKSGLLDKAAAEAYRQKLETAGTLPDTPKKLAELMIRDGLLTNFQADHLLMGKWRGFVIASKYRLLQRVGAGGMGSVYLCEHILMKRRVALKVLPASQAEDKAALDRFHREARAVAALDHPNIVRAHDIDHEDKLHFLVMEYVDGSSMQDIIKRFGPMEVQRAVHYMAQAACGLQHAHEAGIVHRDIKPGNLLVDRTGTVKILDMGLARFFHDDGDQLTKQYDATSVLGTADYLAPEQALNSHDVDVRADIYSLGATLYFLLAGVSPFQEGTVAQKLIWHQVREPKPIQGLRPDVTEELAAIVRKMMAKNVEDRFQTPLELMEALAPWMQMPIPPPPEEEMPQLVGAAQALAGETGRTLSPTSRAAMRTARPMVGPGLRTEPGSGRSGPQAPLDAGSNTPGRSSREGSDTPRTPAPGQGQYASASRIQRMQADADRFDPLRPYDPSELPDFASHRRMRIWVVVGIACLLTTLGYGGVILWAVARNASTESAAQLKTLPAITGVQMLVQVRAFEGHQGPIESVAVTPDGQRMLSAGEDSTLRLWEIGTGKLQRNFIGHAGPVHGIAVSPDGKRALSAGWDKTLRLWDLFKGNEIKRFQGHGDRVQDVAFAPDGRFAVSAGSDKLVILWDAGTGQPLHRLNGHTGVVWSVAFGPDSCLVVSGSDDKTVRVWDANSGQELKKLEGHGEAVLAVAVSPDGRHAVSGGKDKTIRLWDVDSGQLLNTFVGHTAAVAGLAFSPDGRHVASGSDDQTVRLWEAATGYELWQYKGHNQPVTSVTFARDGKHLFSGGKDAAVRQWSLPRYTQAPLLREVAFFPARDVVERVAFSPDGKLAASVGVDKAVHLWNVDPPVGERQLTEHQETGNYVTFSADGQRVLSASKDGTIKLWDVVGGTVIRTFGGGHPGGVLMAVFTPNEKEILSCGQDGSAKLWSVDKGTVIRTFLGGKQPHVVSVCWVGKTRQLVTASKDKSVRLWNDNNTNKDIRSFGVNRRTGGPIGNPTTVACSPDGKRLLIASQDGMLRLFEINTGKRLVHWQAHDKGFVFVSFSPDGRFAVSSGADKKTQKIRLWDVEQPQRPRLLQEYSGHSGVVTATVFSPDGRQLLSGSKDRTVRLWNLPGFTTVVPLGEVRVFRGHGKEVNRVVFAPDGKRILSAGSDNTVRLWQAFTGQELHRFAEHTDKAQFVAFSPDGKLAVSAGDDKAIRIWETEKGQQLRVINGHLKKVWSAVFTPDGKRVFSGSEDAVALLSEVETGKVLHKFYGHSASINCVAVSPDGRKGLTASSDKTVRLWDLETGKELRQFLAHQGNVNCVAFSPDGRHALSGSADKFVIFWEVDSGNPLHIFSGHTNAVNFVAFSPEGKRFLSCGADKTVRLWDIPRKKLLHTYEGHAGAVTGVAFSPDGRFAVSSSVDQTIRLWGVPVSWPQPAQ